MTSVTVIKRNNFSSLLSYFPFSLLLPFLFLMPPSPQPLSPPSPSPSSHFSPSSSSHPSPPPPSLLYWVHGWLTGKYHGGRSDCYLVQVACVAVLGIECGSDSACFKQVAPCLQFTLIPEGLAHKLRHHIVIFPYQMT